MEDNFSLAKILESTPISHNLEGAPRPSTPGTRSTTVGSCKATSANNRSPAYLVAA